MSLLYSITPDICLCIHPQLRTKAWYQLSLPISDQPQDKPAYFSPGDRESDDVILFTSQSSLC